MERLVAHQHPARPRHSSPSARIYLPGHAVQTAFERGWSELQNGDLLESAQAEGFEILIYNRPEAEGSAGFDTPRDRHPGIDHDELAEDSASRRESGGSPRSFTTG